MTHVSRVVVALSCLIAAGCTKTPPPSLVYVEPTIERQYAPECTSNKDPQWLQLPEGDAKRSETARNYRENKTRFAELRRLRAACRASHKAHGGGD